jgi:hypothetical protein
MAGISDLRSNGKVSQRQGRPPQTRERSLVWVLLGPGWVKVF